MKFFLPALLALAMIAGCSGTEEESSPDTGSSEASSEQSTNDDNTESSTTEEALNEATDEVDSPEVTKNSDKDTKPTNTASGLKASDLAGEWTGMFVFNEADRQLAKSQGATDEAVDQQISLMESISIKLVLNSDLSFTQDVTTPMGDQSTTSTWSIVDDNTITIIMKIPAGPGGEESKMPMSMTVSKDRKQLEMPDPNGMMQSTTVYTKN